MNQGPIEIVAPQVVALPCEVQLGDHRVYRNVLDDAQLSVDVLEARISTHAFRLAQDRRPGRRAARPVSVSFGAGDKALRSARRRFAGQRATPIRWNSGPFFAWVRKAAGVTLVDRGETRRGRMHEAHIEGVQPPGVELARAVAAAELVHYGRLDGLSVRAEASTGAIAEVCEVARLGRRAAWTATLAEAVVVALGDLLRRDRLQITVVAGSPLPLRAFDEVRELVMMEWAHRLAGAHPLSLPAAHVAQLFGERVVDLTINWRSGDRVPLRVVRPVSYESIPANIVQTLRWGLGGRPRVAALAQA